MNPDEIGGAGGIPSVLPVLTADKEAEFDFKTCMLNVKDQFNVEVIYMGEVEEKYLAIFPRSAWHKSTSKRVLPPGTISRPVALQVDGCYVSQREERLLDHPVMVWMGFVTEELLDSLVEVEDGDARASLDHPFCSAGDRDFLPHLQGLAALAMEHFNFVSAESAMEVPGSSPGQEEGEGGAGPRSMQERMEFLEDSMARMAASMEALVQQRSASGSPGIAAMASPPTTNARQKVHFNPVPIVVPSGPPKLRRRNQCL